MVSPEPEFEVVERLERASTIPSRFYTDDHTFELANERILACSWQFASDIQQVKVPGQVHPFILLEGCLDEPLLLTRDVGDHLHCLSNVCTHRGNIVCEGAANLKSLRCRYHGRRFSLDGTCQFMPEFEEVEGFPAESDNLPEVPFGLWRGLLFAGIEPRQPLDEWLAPVQERIGWMPIEEFAYDAGRARDYLVRAHWALYVDNYLEGFHIPYIHAALNQQLDYGEYVIELFPGGNVQVGVASGAEESFDLPPSSTDYGHRIAAYYFWMFPNLMLNFYPWGLSINVVTPLSPDRTKVRFLPYVWDASKLDAGAGAELDRVEREDEAIVELVQRGVRSRFYDRGRYSVKRENGVHQFHRLVADAMSR